MYRALYRKWRPLAFQDVVGQAPIVTALRNQIATQHVGHAYLFTGVRGTGKTTCAKIFAKAINCMNPDAGDPCGQCEACRGIENGSILDVVEMDAASNNGVDNIRDLRDETAYTPSACQYKVYIIDEVHMLSTAAFNALLKTLEEPPPHVVFILATTEIQKVPATILSRCQRYDFTRIQPSDLAARAQYVAQQEGLTLTDDAADLIARLADGAARDTLSILDTCAGVSSEIDAELVRRMTGVTDRSYLFTISHCILTGDSVGMLAEIAALRQKSVDLKRLTEELILHYRNLMLSALPNGASLLSGVSPQEEAQYLSACKETPQAECVRAIRALGTALEKMTRGGDARIELELALFSLHAPLPAAPVASTNTAPQATPAAAPAPFARASATQAAPFASAPVAQPAPFASAPAPSAPTAPTAAVPASPPQPPAPVAVAEPSVPAVTPTAPAAPVSPAPVVPPVAELPAPVAAREVAPPTADLSAPNPTEDDAPPPFSDNDAPPLPDKGDIPYHPYDDMVVPEPDIPDVLNVPDASDVDAITLPAEEETLLDAVKKHHKRRTAAANKAASAAQPTETANTDEIQVFAQWNEVRAALAARDPMLNSYLKRAHGAYKKGNHILIDADPPVFDVLRESKECKKFLKDVLLEITGIPYAIGPYRESDTPTTQRSATDLLQDLAVAGVEIAIKE